MMRECEHCGGPIPDHRNADAMYCCVKCKSAAYSAAITAARLEAKAGRWCEWCGDTIPATKNAGARFCNPKCQREARYRADIEARPVQTCAACGTGFRPVRDDGRQKYCSHQCGQAAYRTGYPINCHQCGDEIQNPRRDQKFCGNRCQQRWHRRRRQAKS
jgi:hypothetical protein